MGERLRYRIATINGEPGLLRYIDGPLESAQAVVTDGERIVAIYAMRNPDKLARIARLRVATAVTRRGHWRVLQQEHDPASTPFEGNAP